MDFKICDLCGAAMSEPYMRLRAYASLSAKCEEEFQLCEHCYYSLCSAKDETLDKAEARLKELFPGCKKG